MKKARALVLLGLVLFAAIAVAPAKGDEDTEYDDDDAALLVARKSLLDEAPSAVGKAATVVIELYNAGESTAKNIQIDDSAELPDGVSLAPNAQTTATIKKLDAGETTKISYDIVPTLGGRAIQLPRAKVTYGVYEGGKEGKRSGASSSPVIYVETTTELAFRHALTAGSYATLGLIRTPEQWRSLALIGAFVVFVFGGSSVFGKTKAAAASSRRAKALAALEKEK